MLGRIQSHSFVVWSSVARGLQQRECDLRGALETRKAALFLDGCLGFV